MHFQEQIEQISLSWKLAARLVLLGYIKGSPIGYRPLRSMKPEGPIYMASTIWQGSGYTPIKAWDDDRIAGLLRGYRANYKAYSEQNGSKRDPLKQTFFNCYMPVITFFEAKEFFRENYGIDFIERPHIGREKLYICDPVGPGLGQPRLKAVATPKEALIQCIEYLLEKVEPLTYKEGETRSEEEHE